MQMRKGSTTLKVIAACVAVSFAAVFLLADALRAKEGAAAVMGLPEPAKILKPSADYELPLLKGIKINPDAPMDLAFIIDGGDKDRVNKRDVALLANYFLAGVTMPGEDLWVNLSPYESDRIISEGLAQTDLGKDMLSQDYVLKQFMSSATCPKDGSGKDFWRETLKKVAAELGTTNVPVNTFNKVWIVPGEAEVAEEDTTAVVTYAHLNVMLEQDYLALGKANAEVSGIQGGDERTAKVNAITEDVVREKILPIIEKEVNEGKNFATIRQMYYALILSTWFRQKMYQSFYKHYMNTSKAQGIEIAEKDAKAKVYALYNEAFKKGVYDFMSKERDLGTGKMIGRHYFSGGAKITSSAVGQTTRFARLKEEVKVFVDKMRNGVIAMLSLGALSNTAQTPAMVKNANNTMYQKVVESKKIASSALEDMTPVVFSDAIRTVVRNALIADGVAAEQAEVKLKKVDEVYAAMNALVSEYHAGATDGLTAKLAGIFSVLSEHLNIANVDLRKAAYKEANKGLMPALNVILKGEIGIALEAYLGGGGEVNAYLLEDGRVLRLINNEFAAKKVMRLTKAALAVMHQDGFPMKENYLNTEIIPTATGNEFIVQEKMTGTEADTYINGLLAEGKQGEILKVMNQIRAFVKDSEANGLYISDVQIGNFIVVKDGEEIRIKVADIAQMSTKVPTNESVVDDYFKHDAALDALWVQAGKELSSVSDAVLETEKKPDQKDSEKITQQVGQISQQTETADVTAGSKGVDSSGIVQDAQAQKKDDKLGGIDFADIKVKAAPMSKSLEIAPFDVNTFGGFSFKVTSLKRATKADIEALIA